ncbi:MAG TPA: PAS domain-containing protein [Chloroflexi bacterium]|nr:PAS domain-containing protein [Chloroflexota bacterium]
MRESETRELFRELQAIDWPVRWLLWAGGLYIVWAAHQSSLPVESWPGFLVYGLLNLAIVLASRHFQTRPAPLIAIVYIGYVADFLFASLLIYYTGGISSPVYLLYGFLSIKAAIFYPYTHPLIFIPIFTFPIYLATLFLQTGTLVFLTEQLFLWRYTLLLLVILAVLYTAWHLDHRHQRIRALYEEVDRQRRELGAILRSIGDGVIVVDREMRLQMINPVAAAEWDLEGLPVVGRPLSQLLGDVTLEGVLREAMEVGEQGGIAEALITVPSRQRGKVVTYEALASAIVPRPGDLWGAVVVLRDITKQKEADQLKSNFLSVISHELRTPLTTIRGYVEYLLMEGAGPLDGFMRRSLETVFRQTEHLQGMINDLLEFAQMEAEQVGLFPEDVPLNELITDVVERISPLAKEADMELTWEVPAEPLIVRADAIRLRQVLVNLLDNALKFTPAGGQIRVQVERRPMEVLISVNDTGPGIPPAERERIFERFYQIDNSSTRAHSGTGLGLAICRQIVELHHGRIWVEEGDGGVGSRFCFTIPCDPVSPSPV